MPIPAGTSSDPSGSTHPGVRLGDDHPPWSRTQLEDGSHASGAASSRCGLLPCPPRRRPRRAPRHGGLAGLVAQRASAAAAAPTQPGGPGPPPTSP
jgi:hypothetical protein